MVDFPVAAIPRKTLLRLMRLFLHTLMGVELMKEMPVDSPKHCVLRNSTMGSWFEQIRGSFRLLKNGLRYGLALYTS